MKYYKNILTFLFFYYSIIEICAQTNISGVINSYAQVLFIESGNCPDSVFVNSTIGFSVGDSVLIIQMQGADIDSTNTPLFGTINSYIDCGNYEFLKIAGINGNSILFTTSLKRTYSINGFVQLVTKPVYSSATVTGILSAQPWNGLTGGVLTFSVTSDLTLNNDIDVSGLGFRGGRASANYYTNWFSDFCFGYLPGRGGQKGESIAAYFSNKEYGRGAQAGGGGGGADINTGAAGGGNYGSGGHGGNNFFAPDTLWGIRGKSLLSGINQSKIFAGSGGGGGHQNNSEGTAGGNGGGIIMIYANNIIGNNHFIKSNGANVIPIAGIDGAGGGGSGGSILIDALNFNTNVIIEVKGGKGGDQNYPPQCHGNGGGGGGGVLLYPYSALPANVLTNLSGGLQGVGQCNNSIDDAAVGDSGGVILNWYNPDQQIQAGFSITLQGCSYNVNFINQSQNGVSYLWDFGDGFSDTGSNPSHVYSGAGTYNVTLIVYGSCTSDTLVQQITLNTFTQPQAGFSNTLQSCSYNVDFINQSQNGISYLWDFGDGFSDTASNPSHDYANAGTYSVSLIVYGACTNDTLVLQLTLNAFSQPQAGFSNTLQSCSYNVDFINQSQNQISYLWDFGDGFSDTVSNPSHVYANAGTYIVTLIVYGICLSDTLTQQLTVNDIPVTQAHYSVQSEVCSKTVNFNNLSLNNISSFWDFGDGVTSTLSSVSHTYADTGLYNIMFIAYGQCDSDTDFFILPATFSIGIASFEFEQQPCEGEIKFINKSQNAFSVLWDFGDGKIDNELNPVHSYTIDGTYLVTMYVNEGTLCSDTLIQTIKAHSTVEFSLFVPNSFTPNNDGLNEFFQIQGKNDCKELELFIYNRWGNLIYKSNDIFRPWDGRVDNNFVQEGVYCYKIIGDDYLKTGSLSVIR